MADDKKRYNHMENVFQHVNKKFVSLDENLIKRNNKILKGIVESIVENMKKNELFRSLYRHIYFGGSYYDGLKVGKPEEYDLDLVMDLPKYANPTITLSEIPGFVQVKLTDLEKFQKQPEYVASYTKLSNLLDEQNYMCTNKVLPWMEGLVTKALKEFPESGNMSLFVIESKKYYAKIVKGGPAFTLKIHGDDPVESMDIDLVPCFLFKDENWPTGNFRQNPCKAEKPHFFIVPKAPKGKFAQSNQERCWRLSFQEQELFLMNGKGVLKPSLKLLKKLRDRMKDSCISSYFLKTVFLWKIVNSKDDFWKQTLASMYIAMLKEYAAHIRENNIPYFWNKQFNLIANVNPITLENIKNRLNNTINEIERNEADPYIGAKALLTEEDFKMLKDDVQVTKKQLKIYNSVVSTQCESTCVKAANSTPAAQKPAVNCVDGFVENDNEKTKILTAMNKLMHDFNKMKVEHQQALEGINNHIACKMDNLESSVKDLKDEIVLLRRQLNQNNAQSVSHVLPVDRLLPTVQYLNNDGLLLDLL